METETIIHAVTPFSRFEHALVGCLYMVLCVVGVSLNLMTALTFYKDVRLLTSSKPWLHIALALANAGVVGPSPFPASSSVSGRWLYGSTLCQLYAFEGMFIGIMAISFVIAICIERYAIGSKPNAGNSGWFYVFAIGLTVCNAFFWAAMPLLGWSRYTIDVTGTSCSLDYGHPDDGFVSYLFSLEIFSFGIPMVIAAICLYCSGGESASSTTTTSQDETAVAGGSSMGQSSSGQSSNPTVVLNDHLNVAGFSEDQLKTLCYVFLLFVLVGWGPFAFICTMGATRGTNGVSMLANVIPPLSCKLMVSAYPVAYLIASPRFRNSFSSFFKGQTEGAAKQD